MRVTTRSDSPLSPPPCTHARARPLHRTDTLENSGLSDLQQAVSEAVVVIQCRHRLLHIALDPLRVGSSCPVD